MSEVQIPVDRTVPEWNITNRVIRAACRVFWYAMVIAIISIHTHVDPKDKKITAGSWHYICGICMVIGILADVLFTIGLMN